MYRALFLDWDDTLGDWSSSALAAQKDIYQKYHLQEFYSHFEDWFEAYHEHNTLLWEQYGRGEVTKEFLHRDRFIFPIVQALGGGEILMQSPRLIDLAERMGQDFLRLTNEYFHLLSDVADVVRELAEKYPLTIVSNGFVEVQYYKIQQSGLRDCFQHIVLSEEVGIQKPDARIFDEAIRLNNERIAQHNTHSDYIEAPLTKADVLMIGDGYSSDIQGAINAGIDQAWIVPNEDAFNDTTRPATYKIHRLNEVWNILTNNSLPD